MAACFHNQPLVHGDDAVAMTHGGETVGDDQYGAVAADGLHVLHDGAFGFVVQRTGCLVKNQDARITDNAATLDDSLYRK